MALIIADWHKHFYYKEANDAKNIFWRRHPVTHNSVKFRRLMRDAEGRTAYCVFIVIVDLCARARSENRLETDSERIDAEVVSLATGIPQKTVQRAFDLLSSKEVGWLIDSESIENRSEVDSESNSEQSRAEQELEIEKSKAEPSSAPDSSASQICSAPPSQSRDDFTNEYAMKCLVEVGVLPARAAQIVAEARINFGATGNARIVKGVSKAVQARQKGKQIADVANYIEVAGELKKSLKQKTAEAKANVAAQVRLVKEQGAA